MDKKKQHKPIAQELIVSKKFKHKMEKSYKERIHLQNQEEKEEEIKEYISGELYIMDESKK